MIFPFFSPRALLDFSCLVPSSKIMIYAHQPAPLKVRHFHLRNFFPSPGTDFSSRYFGLHTKANTTLSSIAINRNMLVLIAHKSTYDTDSECELAIGIIGSQILIQTRLRLHTNAVAILTLSANVPLVGQCYQLPVLQCS